MPQLTMAKALNEGLRSAMERDPKVLLMGEDIGRLGGVFRVTDGLQKDFGEARVFDTPLAESGIVGTAIGLAIRGYRPVCEIQFDGFIYPAYDQIVSQLAKMRARSLGDVALPVVKDFIAFARDVAMHVAASPTVKYVNVEDVPQEEKDAELRVFVQQAEAEGKPENIREKIATGKLNKWLEEIVLVKQVHVNADKHESKTIEQIREQLSVTTGENVVVRRFERFAVGE